jgi:hypothetical protein
MWFAQSELLVYWENEDVFVLRHKIFIKSNYMAILESKYVGLI